MDELKIRYSKGFYVDFQSWHGKKKLTKFKNIVDLIEEVVNNISNSDNRETMYKMHIHPSVVKRLGRGKRILEKLISYQNKVASVRVNVDYH